MKIYRIMGTRGHTTIPWKIRESMGLKESDVLSFEYGAFGDDIILVRRELISESDDIPDDIFDGGSDDIPPSDEEYGGEFADELEEEINEDLEVKALFDFISGFSEKAQRTALLHFSFLLSKESGESGEKEAAKNED